MVERLPHHNLQRSPVIDAQSNLYPSVSHLVTGESSLAQLVQPARPGGPGVGQQGGSPAVRGPIQLRIKLFFWQLVLLKLLLSYFPRLLPRFPKPERLEHSLPGCPGGDQVQLLGQAVHRAGGEELGQGGIVPVVAVLVPSDGVHHPTPASHHLRTGAPHSARSGYVCTTFVRYTRALQAPPSLHFLTPLMSGPTRMERR